MPAVQIPCPNCESRMSFVVSTGNGEEGIVRRRKCNSCGYRWYTFQEHEIPIPACYVVTSDKKPFLRKKDD